ncbi:MAG: hypothetical protein R3202_09315 [Candidatus Competibacterales bacterium]|nr:hypothetical protein [Candidatus Competibacterales bacterium]
MRLPLLWCALLPGLLYSTPSSALFKCVDAKGIPTFRDTPCPTSAAGDSSARSTQRGQTLDNNRAWVEAAKLAARLDLGMPLDAVRELLGEPVEVQAQDNRGRYVFSKRISSNIVYRVTLYTVDDQITAIEDQFQRRWARGKIWPGLSREDVVQIWGEPSAVASSAADSGTETVLEYKPRDTTKPGDKVFLADGVVTDIQYGTP